MDGDEVGSEEVGSEGMVTGERKERKKEKKKKRKKQSGGGKRKWRWRRGTMRGHEIA